MGKLRLRERTWQRHDSNTGVWGTPKAHVLLALPTAFLLKVKTSLATPHVQVPKGGLVSSSQALLCFSDCHCPIKAGSMEGREGETSPHLRLFENRGSKGFLPVLICSSQAECLGFCLLPTSLVPTLVQVRSSGRDSLPKQRRLALEKCSYFV